MKIDRSRLKKSTSEVPAECQALIDKLRSCTQNELLDELKAIDAWTFGKCELYHWIDILDIFDSILEEGARQISPNNWIINCDLQENEQVKVLLLWILRFTTILIEHSFSRHLYNSMEHLIALLASCDMNVVLAVLNLLYMFSKRSNFLQRINNEKRVALIQRLTYLAENWGARHGYSLSNCVANKPIHEYPPETTTLHYEYYAEVTDTSQTVSGKNKSYSSSPVVIHIEKLHTLNKTPAEIMNDIVLRYPPPRDKQVLMMLFTYIRSAVNFPNYPVRLLCVQARLQALSVLAYSNALAECAHTLLYEGLVEELRNVLHIAVDDQVEIRASAVRTLTSIIHLDRNPHFPKKSGSRLSMIIDVTGASSYHGFLPTLTRSCIYDLIRGDSKYEYFPPYEFRVEKYSLPLATSLFSFLYHLASYEAGGEALVSCGMMDSLLQVIDWPGHELEHITFVTRAVRVIDLITNIEMQGFQARGGLTSFINRLEMEVNICRKEQPFEIPTADSSPPDDEEMRPPEDERPPVLEEMDVEPAVSRDSGVNPPSLPEGAHTPHTDAGGESSILRRQKEYDAAKTGKMCLPQRAALLKSMLNFLKKAIQDTSFADSIRHIMDGSLPSSLRHIISNAEYYGPSLFLLATDVVTVYVFQEPSLLSSLQDNGLTHVVLEALLVKDVPATREVLGSLPNVFSALCLNDRGLAQFIVCNPFESLFKVLLSPVYLGAMRRRRTTDPIGDTASNLGNAMDELMRHQPTLKSSATSAIIKLLEELCELGRDPKYVCWRAQNRMDVSPTPAPRPSTSNEGGSSDEEEEDEEEASTSSHTQREETTAETTNLSERQPVALLDYIINVMKFVDAILSNNSTDDHCREFVAQKGLPPLMSILGLPNLPVDYPVIAAPQAVATVCKSILNLSHEPQVLKIGLMQLSVVLDSLRSLHCPVEEPGSSVLLHELATAPNLETAFSTASATPLLHAMSAAHGYVVMFVHVCRTGQTEIRSLSISHWASELGLSVLRGLARLYSSLVWESTLLLALCSDDIIPADSKFGKDDLEKLLPPELRSDDGPWRSEAGNSGTSMEAMNTDDDIQVIVEECGFKTKEGSRQLPSAVQLKYIRPLLGASSRLGRALAELFGLLVKLCVGSPMRQRRGQQLATSTPLVPSPPARAVAGALTDLLVDGLNWKLLPSTRITKFKFTFLICSVGFTSPMLGDEKKCAYHLMLQKFGSLGFTAFLDTFYWAISGGHKFDAYNGLEHPDLPEGTGEFLDAWLLLLEKLVNPKNVLESPHSISVKHGIIYKPFDAVSYLHKIHQRAFVAVGHLWGKKPLKHYGPRMSDTMMAIFKHILRGEKIWLEHCRKNKDRASQPGEGGSGTSSSTPNVTGDSSTSGSSTARRPVDLDTPEPEVNQEALNQLMDMGFSRDHCVEALFHTSSVEQATEYLLTYPLTHNRPAHHSSMDVDLTEEDQMSRAISLSLSEKISSDSENKETQKQSTEPGMDLDESLLIDKFTEHVLKDCLQLMDDIPDTVFRACELLVAVAKRNGKTWCLEMLNDLTFEIATRIYYMIGIMESPRVKPSEVVTELVESDAAIKAAVRIHLFTLLFEPWLQGPQEMRLACIEVVSQTCINEGCCQLLIKAQKVLEAHGQPVTPKWMAPLILLIDLFEKVAVITHRKNEMLMVTNNVWRWFDLTSGKWTAYSVSNNKIINEAYWNGESAVRLNCGRRRYVIHFNYMIQTNEESGSRRPVTMSLVCREKTEGKDYPPRSEKKDDKEPDKMDTDVSEEDERRKKYKKMNSISRDVREALVSACVGILALPANTDTLHAAMRLCLRLSRVYENARTFAKLGGVGFLLNLTKASSFGGFQELATMLIRHAIEEPVTLRHAMEKVIRSRTLPNIPPPYKEILYLMRNTSSCVCRDPNAYLEVACDILRCDLNLLPKRSEEDDPRLLVKAQPSRWNTALVMQEDAAVQVISDLLNALTRVVLCSEKTEEPEPDKEKPPTKKTVYCSYNILPVHNTLMHRYPGDPLLPDAIEDREQVRMFHQNHDTSNNSQRTNRDEEGEHSVQAPQRNDGEKSGPLMPKSSILKILADAVRSYSACAKLIIDHTYTAGISELVNEDCTALAFILDKLIPVNENQYDRECQSTARMLISAIASCNHTPEAQTTLVCELKAALLRSLAMPESVEKHTRIANLSAIILHTIENCPPLVNQPQTPSMKLHQYSNNVNNIVKVMLRKGLLTDLARIAHYMDLSSPHVVNSINAVLKPLETLSRIVNQPSTTPPSKTGKAKPQVHANGSAEHTGTTTSEATHAQGEEAVEDAENTDHDISGTAESLEPTSESQVQEDAVDDAVLDDVMDQLLERDGVGSNEENILNASFTVEPEPQSNRMETDDVHTPIRNQSSLPYGNEDDDTQDVDRVQSSDSDSGSNPSDDPDEEVNNVDDDDDDDDEEEEDEEGDDNEDEEGGSGYDEDGLEFFESDDGLFRIPGLDRENEDILMIQYSDPDLSGPGPPVPWNSNSFPIPLGIFEDPGNGNEATAINRLTPNHPLLTARHPSDTNNLTGPRAQRGNRPRRYQYLQLNGRSPNPPVILQRLLGPGNHDLSITTNQTGYRDATRVVVMDNGMGLFANTNSEEEQIDFVDQSGYLFGPSLTATLSNIPTALWWWCEEGKLLDGDSQPDCVVANASKVIEVLEITKAEEIALRRERFRKRMEEEESKKRKEEKKISTEGDTEVASTSSGQPARRSSIATGNSDVASATESLAESIVESVLRPTLQSQPQPDGPDFSELTTGLLCSLSEILPSVTAPQNPLPRTSAEQTMQSDAAAAGATTPAATAAPSATAAVTATAAAAVAAAPPPPPPPVEGEPELPEGVDPSFLAALPDEVREEVIAEQLRLQRLRQRAVQQSSETAPTSVTEVNPEFLAALPPAIQEEVLAQQRMEQQRQAAATANPNDPVDAAAFFQNLQPSLRQAILTDMEDSQISVLPPDLAQEAQNLRREWEARNRQLMQERFFSHVSHNNSALSSILRNTGRVGSARYAIHAVPQRAQWNPWNTRPDPHPAMPLASHGLRLRGRQLLDHEALACLLVLLFLDEPKLNTARLHRVLRNLCYHGPTREWVIKALLSILDLCTEPKRDGRRKPQYNFFTTPLWLNVKMDTALGLRARVFNIGHQAGKRGNRSLETTGITVHKRAAPVIIRHTLEVLISLAKTFPGYFLPLKNKGADKDANKDGGSKSRASTSAGPSGSKSSRNDLANFWDILLKLDSTTYSKKGKSVARSHCLPGPVCDDEHHTHSFESSPFGQLMKMLQKFPGYGPTLVDKMLRLLSLISIGLPEINPYLRHREHTEGKKTEERDESVPVSKEYVRKIMTQLELQTCSEEGLEDATALLLNLSNCPDPTKEIIYGVLINGAINTANFVSQLLRGVQMELDDVNSRWDQDPFDDKDDYDDIDENVVSDSDEEYENSDQNQNNSNEIKGNNFESERLYNSYDESEVLPEENYETLQEDYDTLQDYDDEGDDNENDNEDSGDGDYDYVDANDDTAGFGDVDSFGDEVDVYCDEDHGESGDNDEYNNGESDDVNKDGNMDNEEAADNFNDGEDQDATTGELNKGIVPDRFTNGTVVVSAPVKVKGCYDVFMPSLNSLTKRTSTQAFFLRMLRVIVQIRESVRMSRRRRQENNDNATGGAAASATQATTTSSTISSTTTTTTTATTTTAAAAATAAKTKDEEPVLPPLSQELEQIDHLWDTLSSVLTKLAETPDNHHAVMSLQPTVEAFFLVHSTTGEEQRSVYEGRLDPSLGAVHGAYSDDRSTAFLPDESHERRRLDESDLDADPDDADDFDPIEMLNQASPSFSPDNSPAPVNNILDDYTNPSERSPAERSSPSSQNSNSSPNTAILSSPSTFSYAAPLAPVSPLQPDADGSAGTNAQQSPVFQSSTWEQTSPPVTLNPDQQKFLKFAEKHRAVLNQILRQSSTHLADGPFAVLVDHTRVLDFDVKRKYFRSELERMDEGIRREELAVHVRRSHVFEDSFRELHRRTIDEWKNRFYIVFEGEEGQDAGGLLREWYVIISREIFNPMYALFTTSPGDRVTYMINPSSHCNPNHLCYFKFVGRVIAKAIYDNKLLECYFTRSFYKHILGIHVKHTDMESEDYSFYQGLVYLMEHHVSDLGYDLTFSAEVQEFGVTDVRDLIPNGRNIPVTESNKMDYIRLVCQMKMTGAIRKQINAFLEGFYDIIPKRLISIFNEQELELLISGMPNVDIEDLKANTEYHKYQPNSLQIQWFWRALRGFDQADRAKFLQFVTGTSKVPLQGFAALEGMNGVQKFQIHRDDRSTDRLPSAHTCFNQLDLPVYETYDKLRTYLLKAIHECSEGFGFA